MTVGEKIQQYRKALQMSQDELGQKLNVSRQTISLWETGQTLPTIDNLMLLKKIFGVSVDDLLSSESKSEESESNVNVMSPAESYTFNLTPQEYAKINKLNTKNIRFSLVVSVVVFVGILIFIIVKGQISDWVMGTVFGLSIMEMVVNIKANVMANRNARMCSGRVCGTAYHYDLYDGFFIVTLYRGGECVKTEKIYTQDIEKIHILGDYYLFVYAGQSWIIKKKEITENSIFHQIVNEAPRKMVVKTSASKWNALAVTLNVASLFTILFGLMILSVFNITGENMVQHFWIFALFVPVTAASVALGFYLKKTSDKGRPNIIIGIVTTALLIVFASFSVIMPAISKNASECLATVESCVDMDIPHYKEYNIKNYANITGIKRFAVFSFTENNTKNFEYELMISDKWLRYVPASIAELANYGYNAGNADYFFICNLDTGELNTVPAESGTYNFINGYYDVNDNEMIIVEYSYNFDK